IKNPEILVFDDSFSALDYKTDVALRRALREETKNTTKILVAQRISTVLDAYEILVLDKGKIFGPIIENAVLPIANSTTKITENLYLNK
ncbi:MAG: ABC transporter, ATP-binding/permease protein, partial [Clostridium butyricum DORA_1]